MFRALLMSYIYTTVHPYVSVSLRLNKKLNSEVHSPHTLQPVADSQSKRNTRAKRIRRKKLGRGEIHDNDATEVPPRVYKTWLRETSDIIDQARRRKVCLDHHQYKLLWCI